MLPRMTLPAPAESDAEWLTAPAASSGGARQRSLPLSLLDSDLGQASLLLPAPCSATATLLSGLHFSCIRARMCCVGALMALMPAPVCCHTAGLC